MIRAMPTLAASEREMVSSPQWAEEETGHLDKGGGEEAGHSGSQSETGSSLSDSGSADSMSTVYDSALMSDVQRSENLGDDDDDAGQGSDSASASDIKSEYLWTEEEWQRLQEKEGAQFVAHLNPAHLQRDPRPREGDRRSPLI